MRQNTNAYFRFLTLLGLKMDQITHLQKNSMLIVIAYLRLQFFTKICLNCIWALDLNISMFFFNLGQTSGLQVLFILKPLSRLPTINLYYFSDFIEFVSYRVGICRHGVATRSSGVVRSLTRYLCQVVQHVRVHVLSNSLQCFWIHCNKIHRQQHINKMH